MLRAVNSSAATTYLNIARFGAVRWCAGLVLVCLGGCVHQPVVPTSQGHLGVEPQSRQSAPSDIPKPVRKSAFVPPPKPVVKEQTYSVVVSDVPVKEILFALAREGKMNVDIHPAVQGKATLNAVDQTLPAILERLSKQVDLRYKIEGNVLSVSPDFPVLRTYKVNYVNMDRESTSSLGVGSELSSGGSSSGSDSKSSTTINNKSKANFWELLSSNISNILKSTRNHAVSTEEKAAKAEAMQQAREDRLKQIEAVSRAGAGAEKLYQEAFRTPGQPLAENKEDLIINPVAGTVTVMATERQHGYIQQYIDSVMASVQRQVLIEATIVEVSLNNQFQTGIDWSRLGSAGGDKGFTFKQTLGGAAATTGNQFVVGYTNTASKLGDLAASLRLLETFGNTKVLSSPKIMALNNQPALLKVVDNIVYFEVKVTPATLGSSGNVTSPATYETTKKDVAVGVVMSVTPQINENGNVSLNVRPTISRIIDYVDDPNPELSKANVTNKVPQIQVREMESLLQVDSGQTVVLGGLMQDNIQNKDNSVPGLSRLPMLGKVFQAKDDTRQKTELVIFLRPTIVQSASLKSDELKSFRQFLPDQQFPVRADESAH